MFCWHKWQMTNLNIQPFGKNYVRTIQICLKCGRLKAPWIITNNEPPMTNGFRSYKDFMSKGK